MSDPFDPLEAELAHLRPHGMSRELRPRIAEALADAATAPRRRFWWLALAGGLAAACVVGLLWWNGRNALRRSSEPAPIPRDHDIVRQDEPRSPNDSDRIVMEIRARLDVNEAEMPTFDWPLSERTPIKAAMLMAAE